MPWVYIWTSPLKSAYVGTTPVKEIYVGTTKVRPAENVYTYDFQNNGSLSWTAQSVGYWTPDFVTGQWWRLYRSSTDSQGNIVPPSSLFDNKTLQNVKIWMHKGIATTGTSSRAYAVGAWVENMFIWSFAWANINYDRILNNWTYIQTVNLTGEVTLELSLTWSSPVLSISWNNYTLTATTISAIRSLWTNKTLKIVLWNWRWWSGDLYIRKVEFTTK